MFRNLKIWHFLLALFVLIISLRINFIIELFLLLFFFIRLLFSDPSSALNQLSLNLLDHFISLVIIILLPLLLFMLKKRIKFLFERLNFSYAILSLLISFTIFSPIIATSPPDVHHNISTSKLLPPLSNKSVLRIFEILNFPSDLEQFIKQRQLIFKDGIGENYFIADSIKQNKDIILYQKNRTKAFSKEEFRQKRIVPKTSSVYFLLGTDEFGRDIFSRLIYGTRISLFIGLGSVFISLIIGLVLGFISGYLGKLFDISLNRITEMFLAFPIIFLIILIVGLFGNSLIVIIIVLGLSGWMSIFKIVRGEVVSLKNKDYIITSRLLGFSKTQILIKEMLPVMIAPIVVNLVLQYGNVIIAESALSYLGLGLGNTYPTWGATIEAGQSYLSKAWWISFFPCLFLFLTLLAANNLGRNFEIHFNAKSK